MRYTLLLLILLIGCKRSNSKDNYLQTTLSWNTNALAAQYATDQRIIHSQYTLHPTENLNIYLKEKHLDSVFIQTLKILNTFKHSSFRKDSLPILRAGINHYYNEIQRHVGTRLDAVFDQILTHKEFPPAEKFVIIENRLYLNAVNAEHFLAMSSNQSGCDHFPFPEVFEESNDLKLGDSFRADVLVIENSCEKPIFMKITSMTCNGKKIHLPGTAILSNYAAKIDLLPKKRGKYRIEGIMSMLRSPKDTTTLYFRKSFVVN